MCFTKTPVITAVFLSQYVEQQKTLLSLCFMHMPLFLMLSSSLSPSSKKTNKKKLHFRLHHERKTASGRLSRVCSISLLSSLCRDTESLRGVHRERFHRRRTPKLIYSLICSPLCIWQFHLSYRVLASFNILLFTALHVHLTLLYLQTHLLPK